jgi:hypothetical protein
LFYSFSKPKIFLDLSKIHQLKIFINENIKSSSANTEVIKALFNGSTLFYYRRQNNNITFWKELITMVIVSLADGATTLAYVLPSPGRPTGASTLQTVTHTRP